MDTPQCADTELVERLTAREIEVLCLVAEGCDNETIATRLVLDRATTRSGDDSNTRGPGAHQT